MVHISDMIILRIKIYSVLFLLKEKEPKSSNTDDITAHPCTRLDLAVVISFLQQLFLDVYFKVAICINF
jgi:hypothetical protein